MQLSTAEANLPFGLSTQSREEFWVRGPGSGFDLKWAVCSSTAFQSGWKGVCFRYPRGKPHQKPLPPPKKAGPASPRPLPLGGGSVPPVPAHRPGAAPCPPRRPAAARRGRRAARRRAARRGGRTRTAGRRRRRGRAGPPRRSARPPERGSGRVAAGLGGGGVGVGVVVAGGDGGGPGRGFFNKLWEEAGLDAGIC